MVAVVFEQSLGSEQRSDSAMTSSAVTVGDGPEYCHLPSCSSVGSFDDFRLGAVGLASLVVEGTAAVGWRAAATADLSHKTWCVVSLKWICSFAIKLAVIVDYGIMEPLVKRRWLCSSISESEI